MYERKERTLTDNCLRQYGAYSAIHIRDPYLDLARCRLIQIALLPHVMSCIKEKVYVCSVTHLVIAKGNEKGNVYIARACDIISFIKKRV